MESNNLISNEIFQAKMALASSARPTNDDYGYSFNNPIMEFDEASTMSYLNRLRTDSDIEITYRQKSCLPTAKKVGNSYARIFSYDIYCDGVLLKTLYINPYGISLNIAPKGFHLSTNAEQQGTNNLARPDSVKLPPKTVAAAENIIPNASSKSVSESTLTNEDYGYSSQNPILVGSIAEGYQFLDRLITIDGKKTTYERVGFIITDKKVRNTNVIIDQYDVYASGSKVATLFVNPYAKSVNIAPRKFKLGPILAEDAEHHIKPGSEASPILSAVLKAKESEKRTNVRHSKVQKAVRTQYLLDVKGTNFKTPTLCSCCLSPTMGCEELSVQIGTKKHPSNLKVRMPLCHNCLDHRKNIKRELRGIRGFSIFMGILLIFVLNIFVGSVWSLAISAIASFGLYLLLACNANVGEAKSPHTALKNSVTITNNISKSLCAITPDDYVFTIKFSNGDFAKAFCSMNSDSASAVRELTEPVPLKENTHWNLNDNKFSVISSFVIRFAAWIVILCCCFPSYLWRINNVDGSKSPVDTTVTAASTQTKNPTATPKPTATPTPKPTVAVYNGKTFITPSYKSECSITVSAPTSSNCYVYLMYKHAPLVSATSRELKLLSHSPYESDIAFYVSAGQTAKVNVPIGVYEFYYATGKDFYGTELLFGDNTYCKKSDELLEFTSTINGNYVYCDTYSITLSSVLNGNFETDVIPDELFPKR